MIIVVWGTKIQKAFDEGLYSRVEYLEAKERNRLENDGRWSDEVWRLGAVSREREAAEVRAHTPRVNK